MGKPSRLSQALPFLLVGAALLLLVLPVLDPALQLYDRDTARCEDPFKWEIWRRFAQHQLPLWVTWTEAGTSLLGQMTPGLFHPSTLLYFFLPFEWAFKLQHILALPLAAAGLYLLARALGAGPSASLAGGIIYAGSGWLVSMMGSNIHYALGAAAVPWALHGLLRVFQTRSAGWLLWSAWALSWPIATGEPQSSLIAGLLGGCFALAGTTLRERFSRLGMTALWGICALALAAPAALPAIARLRGNVSAPGSTQSREVYSMPAWRIFGLAIPFASDETLAETKTGELSVYGELSFVKPHTPFAQGITLGLPALLLACFAPGRKRRWLLGGALLAVAAALGPLLPLDRWLLTLVPPLKLFRYPEKWLATATLLIALAAALGADETLEREDKTNEDKTDGEKTERERRAAPARKLAIASIATAIGCAVLWALFGVAENPAREWIAARMATHSQESAAAFVSALRAGLLLEAELLFLLALLAWARVKMAGGRGRTIAPIAVVALLSCSALATSQGLIFLMPLADLRAMPPLADHLREVALGPGPVRVESFASYAMPLGGGVSGSAGTVWSLHALLTEYNARSGVENIAVYSSLADNEYYETFHKAPEALRQLFDVQFVLEEPRIAKRTSPDLAGWQPTPLGLVMQQRARQPRAFFAGCTEAAGLKEAQAKLAAPGFDVHKLALLRPEDAAKIQQPICAPKSGLELRKEPGNLPGELKMTRPSPEEIDVAASSLAPDFLVVAEHFDPGWSASIDGAPTQVVQVDRAALGVYLPEGTHQIVFKFFPVGLRAGLWLALATVLGLLTLSLVQRRLAGRPRRRERSAP